MNRITSYNVCYTKLLRLGLEFSTAVRRGKVPEDAPAAQRVALMQRKQNMGMNALLSLSLALARAVASLRGQRLWELLREELLLLIERLAAAEEIPSYNFV